MLYASQGHSGRPALRTPSRKCSRSVGSRYLSTHSNAKSNIEEGGYCNPGPMRPPYDYIPPEYERAARDCGRRWTEICKRYAN